MITEDRNEKEEFDNVPDADEHGDPIYKIDGDSEEVLESKPEIGEISNSEHSEFKDTPQDLKDETSQE